LRKIGSNLRVRLAIAGVGVGVVGVERRARSVGFVTAF
jgi:hypothetical protein